MIKLKIDFRPLVQIMPNNICSLLFSSQSVLISVISFVSKTILGKELFSFIFYKCDHCGLEKVEKAGQGHTAF